MRTVPAIFDLLRGSVLGTADPDVAEAVTASHDARAIIGAACWHGVENHLLLALRGVPGEPALLAHLQSMYDNSVAVHLRAVADIATLSPLLQRNDIPALVVKGPAFAELYPKPDLRAFSDLDLVVPRARFVDAVDVLRANGCTLLDVDWKTIRDEARAQVHLEAPNGSSIDLHWHLVNRGIARRGLTIDMDGLFSRARDTRLSRVECLTTDPVDTALHAILHGGVQGGARLSHLADVRQAVMAPQVDWDELVARGRSWGVGEMAAIMLERVERVLGATVPRGVITHLRAPHGWSSVVGRIEPVLRPEVRGEGALIARLTRAARPTQPASAVMTAAWLGFQTRGWVARRVGDRIGRAWVDADDRRSEYFAAVAEPATACDGCDG